MDSNAIEIKKTGLLFFDLLNGYYHEASDAAKQKKKPMVDNAVRLMNSSASGHPYFLCKGESSAGRRHNRPAPNRHQHSLETVAGRNSQDG